MRKTVCHQVCRKHHLHQLNWLFMFLHVPSSPAECRCDSEGNNRVSGDAHGDGDATPRHGARKRSEIIRSEPKKRSCGEPLTVLWCLAPCMFNMLNFTCKSNKNMIAVKGKNKHFLVMMIKCVHDMTRTSHIFIYIYKYLNTKKYIRIRTSLVNNTVYTKGMKNNHTFIIYSHGIRHFCKDWWHL